MKKYKRKLRYQPKNINDVSNEKLPNLISAKEQYKMFGIKRFLNYNDFINSNEFYYSLNDDKKRDDLLNKAWLDYKKRDEDIKSGAYLAKRLNLFFDNYINSLKSSGKISEDIIQALENMNVKDRYKLSILKSGDTSKNYALPPMQLFYEVVGANEEEIAEQEKQIRQAITQAGLSKYLDEIEISKLQKQDDVISKENIARIKNKQKAERFVRQYRNKIKQGNLRHKIFKYYSEGKSEIALFATFYDLEQQGRLYTISTHGKKYIRFVSKANQRAYEAFINEKRNQELFDS